jgi:UDP-glucose:(heptosyl)LPS alpha-1,3-glucosyltransferase
VRVAIVIERFDPDAGGVERAAHHQVVELARRGVEVEVVCRRAIAPAPRGARLRVVSVPSFWQPLRVALFSSRAAGVTRDGFDVVHGFARTRHQHIYRAGGGSHAAYMERVYRDAPRRARWSPRHRTILRIEEAVFRDPTQLIQCNARMNAQEIATRYGVPSERLVTIYNGVDTERFNPLRREARGAALRASLHLEGPVALFAGSGFERKGLDRAILGLANAAVHATLLVAGSGDDAPYRALAAQRGIGARVRFLGQRRDVEDLHAAADLFVLPTRYDPFANACLEAMASGLAVATTPANGASELIEPGISGWLGHDDFAPAFALLRDVEKLRGLGRAARQTAEQLTWSRHVDRVLELYQKVVP